MNPTKARLDLLQAIADGAVQRRYPILPEPHYDEWDLGPGVRPAGTSRRRKVTSRVEEFEAAGYVKLLPRAEDGHYKDPRRWDLTPAGRMFLEQNGGTP
jgi:hypothetical protein